MRNKKPAITMSDVARDAGVDYNVSEFLESIKGQ